MNYKWPGEWPASSPVLMFVNPVPDGALRAEAMPDGSIVFAIEGASPEPLTVTSVPITLKTRDIKIAFSWEHPGHFDVAANGALIASLQTPDALPVTVELRALGRRNARDFSVSNDEVRKRRRLQEVNRTPRPGHRLRTIGEEVTFLNQNVLSLRELTDAMKAGHKHHLASAWALTRSLIARGNRNFQPLVQRVAGRLDQPLLLYAPIYDAPPATINGIAPDILYNFSALPTPENGDEAVVDLDVWLDTPGITRRSGEVLSQNDLVRLFADAAGSHFDPDACPDFDEIDAMTLYRLDGLPMSKMLIHCIDIAACIVSVSERLVEAARRRSE